MDGTFNKPAEPLTSEEESKVQTLLKETEEKYRFVRATFLHAPDDGNQLFYRSRSNSKMLRTDFSPEKVVRGKAERQAESLKLEKSR
jgi:hypothetical protein